MGSWSIVTVGRGRRVRRLGLAVRGYDAASRTVTLSAPRVGRGRPFTLHVGGDLADAAGNRLAGGTYTRNLRA